MRPDLGGGGERTISSLWACRGVSPPPQQRKQLSSLLSLVQPGPVSRSALSELYVPVLPWSARSPADHSRGVWPKDSTGKVLDWQKKRAKRRARPGAEHQKPNAGWWCRVVLAGAFAKGPQQVCKEQGQQTRVAASVLRRAHKRAGANGVSFSFSFQATRYENSVVYYAILQLNVFLLLYPPSLTTLH